MNAQDHSDLLEAYVLGALSAQETEEVEAWLAASAEARAQLDDYRAILTAVTVLTPPRRAPSHMAQDFQKRLASLPSEAKLKSQIRVVSRRFWLGLAAVLVVGIGLLAAYAWFSTADARTIQAIRTNPAAITIAMAESGTVSGHVSLIAVPGSTQAVLASDLPALPSDKLYELWMIGDQPVDSGIFTSNGTAKDVLVTIPGPMSAFKVTAITIEPWSEKGSPAPTTNPIFAGNIPQ